MNTHRRYTVTDEVLLADAQNPAIAFDPEERITRNELDALIRSVCELRRLGPPTYGDLTEYDDDGSLWVGDVKIAEVAGTCPACECCDGLGEVEMPDKWVRCGYCDDSGVERAHSSSDAVEST